MIASAVSDGAQAGPYFIAAFLASLVEFVEALTIVLAVGATRGWRPALLGAAAGAALLTLLVVLLGPALLIIPIALLQLVIGTLLLLFGMRWLRKAILRSGGVIALHDEALIFDEETRQLRGAGAVAVAGVDVIGFITTFKAVILEGLEVVFIVIAIGAAAGMMLPAGLGAGLALALVAGLGLALHRPLARVPENALKFTVGVLITTFGMFWIGEGLGFAWPGEEWSLPGLALVLLAVSLITARWVRGSL
ncbi:MAG: TMEM165/GDT1 family protein, partial [Proteobacteria bacterium]|nr:TMEM165/GDT1 family protein [Pseudomonadota bacterium]